nr:MAG TPA: hypothetical protein [Caudoviricetes sp.]
MWLCLHGFILLGCLKIKLNNYKTRVFLCQTS